MMRQFTPAIYFLTGRSRRRAAQNMRRMPRNPREAPIRTDPASPNSVTGLPVFGNSAGAASSAGAGAGVEAGVDTGGGLGAGSALATSLPGAGGGGADPVTATSDEISVFGSSTIFSAAITIPFLSSWTDAFWPFTMNR